MRKYASFSVKESDIKNMSKSKKEKLDDIRCHPRETILVNLISERLNPHVSQIEQYVIETNPKLNSYSIEFRYSKRTEYGKEVMIEESGVLIPHFGTFKDLSAAGYFNDEKKEYVDYFFNWKVIDIYDLNGCTEVGKYQFCRVMPYYDAGIIDLAFKALR